MQILQEEEAENARVVLSELQKTLNSIIFGKEDLVDQLVIALLAGGHVLLEGLPGLGKTQLVKALGQALELEVKRIQFTPDLLPGDVTGTPLLEETEKGRRFVFQEGPVFTNLLLADEINRASPKTQSALLEAMQEKRVTTMGEGRAVPSPFFVLATQNPIELEGTYPLPEAQLDRFLFKLNVERSSVEVLERIVSERYIGEEPKVERVLTKEKLVECMELVRRVYLPDVVANFIARLVDATHPGQSAAASSVKFGASPRAALGLGAAARARALLQGRINTSFEDVISVAAPVLQHRMVLEYSARLEGQDAARVVAALIYEVPTHNREIAGTVTMEAT